MREPVPPAGCVLGRHRGHDLCGVGVGHRPQHALSDDGVGGADHVGGDAGFVAARTSAADSVSSRLTSAASPAASRWCTADRGVASCTA